MKPVFLFPKWTNSLRALIALAIFLGPPYFLVLAYYGGNPGTTDVGYAPVQPVPYSHALHVGQLGMDCRYCHTTVEDAAVAAIPPTEVCMNCHASVRRSSEKLNLVFESAATGMPVEWVRVHDLPDYAYFNHSAHVRRGVGCVSCHGRVDQMEVVYQAKPLSMAWCLDCHRKPENFLRPKEFITSMDWAPPGSQRELGLRLKDEYHINPSTDCTTCHR